MLLYWHCGEDAAWVTETDEIARKQNKNANECNAPEKGREHNLVVHVSKRILLLEESTVRGDVKREHEALHKDEHQQEVGHDLGRGNVAPVGRVPLVTHTALGKERKVPAQASHFGGYK